MAVSATIHEGATPQSLSKLPRTAHVVVTETEANTVIVAAPGAAKFLNVKGIVIPNNSVISTFTLKDGTGTSIAAIVMPAADVPVGFKGFSYRLAANTALTLTVSTATAATVMVVYDLES